MKGLGNLSLISQSEMQDMVEQLANQAKKLDQLEKTLQQERTDKANLEADFQHLLDQLQAGTVHSACMMG